MGFRGTGTLPASFLVRMLPSPGVAYRLGQWWISYDGKYDSTALVGDAHYQAQQLYKRRHSAQNEWRKTGRSNLAGPDSRDGALDDHPHRLCITVMTQPPGEPRVWQCRINSPVPCTDPNASISWMDPWSIQRSDGDVGDPGIITAGSPAGPCIRQGGSSAGTGIHHVSNLSRGAGSRCFLLTVFSLGPRTSR